MVVFVENMIINLDNIRYVERYTLKKNKKWGIRIWWLDKEDITFTFDEYNKYLTVYKTIWTKIEEKEKK